MRVLLQRVLSGKVTVYGKLAGEIGKGYVLFAGFKKEDGEREADVLAEKIVNLRVMSDENGKMGKSILDTGGEILVVSQFTLYANLKEGRRPSFINVAKPETANKLYRYFIDKLRKLGVKNVQTGMFGAYMTVRIVNDGPVTIIIDSKEMNE